MFGSLHKLKSREPVAFPALLSFLRLHALFLSSLVFCSNLKG